MKLSLLLLLLVAVAAKHSHFSKHSSNKPSFAFHDRHIPAARVSHAKKTMSSNMSTHHHFQPLDFHQKHSTAHHMFRGLEETCDAGGMRWGTHSVWKGYYRLPDKTNSCKKLAEAADAYSAFLMNFMLYYKIAAEFGKPEALSATADSGGKLYVGVGAGETVATQSQAAYKKAYSAIKTDLVRFATEVLAHQSDYTASTATAATRFKTCLADYSTVEKQLKKCGGQIAAMMKYYTDYARTLVFLDFLTHSRELARDELGSVSTGSVSTADKDAYIYDTYARSGVGELYVWCTCQELDDSTMVYSNGNTFIVNDLGTQIIYDIKRENWYLDQPDLDYRFSLEEEEDEEAWGWLPTAWNIGTALFGIGCGIASIVTLGAAAPVCIGVGITIASVNLIGRLATAESKEDVAKAVAHAVVDTAAIVIPGAAGWDHTVKAGIEIAKASAEGAYTVYKACNDGDDATDNPRWGNQESWSAVRQESLVASAVLCENCGKEKHTGEPCGCSIQSVQAASVVEVVTVESPKESSNKDHRNGCGECSTM